MRKSITEENRWDEVVDEVVFAYRTAKHASTGYSPFFLMYNRQVTLYGMFQCRYIILLFHYREPVLPSDVNIQEGGEEMETNDAEVEVSVEASVGEDAQAKLTNIRKRVLSNIEVAQARQKRHYDRRSGATEVRKTKDLVSIEKQLFIPNFVLTDVTTWDQSTEEEL